MDTDPIVTVYIETHIDKSFTHSKLVHEPISHFLVSEQQLRNFPLVSCKRFAVADDDDSQDLDVLSYLVLTDKLNEFIHRTSADSISQNTLIIVNELCQSLLSHDFSTALGFKTLVQEQIKPLGAV